jgi:hypothetical protein
LMTSSTKLNHFIPGHPLGLSPLNINSDALDSILLFCPSFSHMKSLQPLTCDQ